MTCDKDKSELNVNITTILLMFSSGPPPSSTVLVSGLVGGAGHQTVVTADCSPDYTSPDQLTDSSQTIHPDLLPLLQQLPLGSSAN